MKSKEFKQPSKDGVELFYQEWRPEGEIVGAIALVHGMGEHIGRYHHFAEFFTAKGWAVLGFDHRGHGKSGGKRGHTPKYDALLDDVAQLIDKAKSEFTGVPVLLYGHSMGGNVVSNFIQRRKADVVGTVISAPWLKLAFEPPAIMVFIGKIMNSIFPGFTQKSDLNADHLSRDKNVGIAYTADPLVHPKITTRMFFSIKDAGIWALENAKSTDFPVLVMHGTEDKITDSGSSQEMAGRMGKSVTMKKWDDFYHELHNEPQQTEVFDFIWNWMPKK